MSLRSANTEIRTKEGRSRRKSGAAKRPPRTCILILGMHRSGTSALTRVLNLMGAALPKNLVPAGRGNETGHWEPAKLAALNDGMLAEAGSSWNDWRKFDLLALPPERRNHYKEEISRLIGDEYGDAPLFVLKDPRICRIAPLYREVLGEMEIEMRPVIVHRMAVDVAASLATRDGIAPVHTHLVWLRHLLDAELATRGLDREFVSYDHLIADWRSVVSRIGAFLKIASIVGDGDCSAIDAFIAPSLRHHFRPADTLAEDPPGAKWQERMIRAFENMKLDPQAATRELDQINVLMDWAVSAFGPVIEAREKEAKAGLEKVRADGETGYRMRIDEREREHGEKLRQLAAEAQYTIGKLETESGAFANRLEAAEKALAAEKARSQQLDRKIQSAQIELEASIFRRLLDGQSRLLEKIRGLSPTLIPLQQLSRARCAQGVSSWTVSGEDPQFDLDLRDRAIAPGYYAIVAHVSANDHGMHNPRLYVDCGSGFSEATSIPLLFRKLAAGRWEARFSLAKEAIRLRLDPSTRPGTLYLSRVGLRPIGRVRRYGSLAAKLALRTIDNPGDAKRLGHSAIDAFRAGGVREIARRLRNIENRQDSGREYADWIRQYDVLTDADLASMRRLSANFPARPLISIVMPTYNSSDRYLREAIDSVFAQTYDNWELCIADDASTDGQVRKTLLEYQRRDSRIKVEFRKANGHIAMASNSALGLATGEWIALLDHDDKLAPHALFCMANAIVGNPGAKLFYSDEDKLDADGKRYGPYFKCDWNPELFRSHSMLTHLCVYHAESLRKLGGFRAGFDGAQDYDLGLRFVESIGEECIVHIPHVLYHWRAAKGSTALDSQEKPYAMLAGERALNEHYRRKGIKAAAKLIGIGFRTDYALPDPAPLVSIVIPARNRREMTERCITSITSRTEYPNFEIILVDNASDDADALAYFREIDRKGIAKVLRDSGPFNYSAINNRAVSRTNGSVIALLNNDVEVISPDWLARMVSLACRPGTGAVGAKLLFPDGTVQHGGVILGLGGLAAHAHQGIGRNDTGYSGRATLAQNISAVTAACLVIRKDHYLAAGGLNESDLAIAYNDVDLCLKLNKFGLRNVWTPFAELYHHESASRGYENTPEKLQRFNKEKAYMLRTWGREIGADIAYSPNLSLDSALFEPAFPPRREFPWRSS